MTAPAIYDLTNDAHAARFGLQAWERDFLLTRCFTGRRDAGHQGRPTHIVFHIQEGSTIGSLDHFVNGHYADGSKVQASCTITIQKDGSILRVIPENHGPWTNGAVRSPKPASAGPRGQGGNVNIWCLTCEMEGFHNQAITEAQMITAEWVGRDWHQRHGIPLDRSHVLEHADVDTVQRANCAGAYFDILAPRLTGGASGPPAGRPDGYGTVIPFPAPVRVTVTASRGVNCRQWGDTAATVFETWNAGTSFWADACVIGEEVAGENRWYRTVGKGWRVWSGATDQASLTRAT